MKKERLTPHQMKTLFSNMEEDDPSPPKPMFPTPNELVELYLGRSLQKETMSQWGQSHTIGMSSFQRSAESPSNIPYYSVGSVTLARASMLLQMTRRNPYRVPRVHQQTPGWAVPSSSPQAHTYRRRWRGRLKNKENQATVSTTTESKPRKRFERAGEQAKAIYTVLSPSSPQPPLMVFLQNQMSVCSVMALNSLRLEAWTVRSNPPLGLTTDIYSPSIGTECLRNETFVPIWFVDLQNKHKVHVFFRDF